MSKFIFIVSMCCLLIGVTTACSSPASPSSTSGSPVGSTTPIVQPITVFPLDFPSNKNMVIGFDVITPGTYTVKAMVSPSNAQFDLTLVGVASAPSVGADRSFIFTVTVPQHYQISLKSYGTGVGLIGGVYPM